MTGRKNASRRSTAEPPRRAGAPRAATRLRACVVIASLRGFDQLSAHLEPRRVVRAAAGVRRRHGRRRGRPPRGDRRRPRRRRAAPLRRALAAPRRSGARRARGGGAAARRRWRCATAGCRRGETRAAALGLAVGVAAGEVLIVDLRAGGGRDNTPVGEPVRRAERLCALARDGETLVDEATYASAGSRLDGELTFTPRPLATPRRASRAAPTALRRAAPAC